MPKYNPNSIWDNKDRKESDYYTPSNKPQPGVGSIPNYEANAKARAEADTDALKKAALQPDPDAKKPPAKPQEPFFKKTPISNFDDEPVHSSHAFLWSVIVFFVLIGAGALYFFFFRPVTGPTVALTFTKPDQVLVGDEFPFSVSIANTSAQTLQGATLSVFLPDNVSFIGQPQDQRVMQETLGNVAPTGNTVSNENFNLIVTGDPNSIKHIDVKMTYGTNPTAQTQFTTDAGSDVVVGNSAIALNIDAPQNVFSGQNFTMNISYTNNTSHNIDNVVLNMNYPPVFSFATANKPAANPANNSWNLGTIPPSGSGQMTITGNVVGPNNGLYAIEGQLLGSVASATYPLSAATVNLALGSSPLSISIALNGKPNYVAKAGDQLNYVITYTNNSNTTFQNVNVKAALVGSMFDFTTVNTNGSFNSVNNTVTWNGAASPQLLDLAPGQSGILNLQIKTKVNYPIKLVSDKNFVLKVNGQIASPTVPAGTAASSTNSAVSVQNQVGGFITLASEGFWRDAANAITNSGPYPPKVNKATQYTIHWIVTNYATDADNVTISGYLQSGTTCTGIIKSNVPSSTPTCNSANGLVSWTIPKIAATTGVLGTPAQAVIQVVNTPAVNQVNQAVTLMGSVTLSASDDFTSQPLTATAGPVTTDLPYDKTISSQDRRVTQ